MLGYLVPAGLLACMFVAAELAFQRLWLAALASLVLALLLPYGDLHGKPLFLRIIGLPEELRSRKRRHLRRHRYT